MRWNFKKIPVTLWCLCMPVHCSIFAYPHPQFVARWLSTTSNIFLMALPICALPCFLTSHLSSQIHSASCDRQHMYLWIILLYIAFRIRRITNNFTVVDLTEAYWPTSNIFLMALPISALLTNFLFVFSTSQRSQRQLQPLHHWQVNPNLSALEFRTILYFNLCWLISTWLIAHLKKIKRIC